MPVHVVPTNDVVEHDPSTDCVCGPNVEYVHPLTGHRYKNGPIVTHHSLDGREFDDSLDEHGFEEEERLARLAADC